MAEWREAEEGIFGLTLPNGLLEIEPDGTQIDPTWSIFLYPGFVKLGTTRGTADEAKAAAVAALRSWLTDMLGDLP